MSNIVQVAGDALSQIEMLSLIGPFIRRETEVSLRGTSRAVAGRTHDNAFDRLAASSRWIGQFSRSRTSLVACCAIVYLTATFMIFSFQLSVYYGLGDQRMRDTLIPLILGAVFSLGILAYFYDAPLRARADAMQKFATKLAPVSATTSSAQQESVHEAGS